MLPEFWFDMAMLWVGTFLYGIYLVLFCICMYILLQRPKTTPTIILIVFTVLLFTLSTTQAVLNLVLGAAEILELDGPFDYIGFVDNMLYPAENLVADSLLLYRCYIIWNRNIFIIIPGIAGLVITSVFGWDTQLTTLAPFYALTLATNIVVTALIAGRIWWMGARDAKISHGKKRQYFSTIAIIVESGVIYIAFVIARILVKTEGEVFLVTEMLRQVMGIVPTLIIVRVGLGVSVETRMSEMSNFKAVTGAGVLDSENSFQSSSHGHVLGSLRSLGEDSTLIVPDAEKGLPPLRPQRPPR